MKKILLTFMAIFAFGLQNVCAQEKPIKIATGNPDLKVQVKRCIASGDQVFIDITFMDEVDDIKASILCEGWSEVHDSEGNTYNGYPKLYIKFGSNEEFTPYGRGFNLSSGVPSKVFFKLKDVPESVEYLAIMKIRIDSKKYGAPNYVTIKNIPIIRD